MLIRLEHDDGFLTVSDRPNGKFHLAAVPRLPGNFVHVSEIETAYPVDLIRTIFKIHGARSTCYAIVRDEDPSSVERLLRNDLFAYFRQEDLDGKRILDFGCGSGASTLVIARLFPSSLVIGVEMSAPLLEIARQTADHYKIENASFLRSPSGTELPGDIGKFDLVIMSAVYEHLLPEEKGPIMTAIWKAVRDGGHLFINQTPNLLFPIELHTTMLPFINYIPDRAAHWAARRFSKRVVPDATWEYLLREGIRGATESEILSMLQRDREHRAVVMDLLRPGPKDRIDLYYTNTNLDRFKLVKKMARVTLKIIRMLTGLTIVPDLSLAFQKPGKTIIATSSVKK